MKGLGLPVIEAKRFNKPCIISPGSLLEIASMNVVVVVNPHHKSDIANAMATYFFDKELTIKLLGKHAFSTCFALLGIKNTKILMEQFYSLTPTIFLGFFILFRPNV